MLKNLQMMQMNLTTHNLLEGGMSEGVAILVTIIGLLVAAALIVFLHYRTKRERERYSEEKMTGNKLTGHVFDALILRRLQQANGRPKFSIIRVTIQNFKELIDVYGEGHYFFAIHRLMHILRKQFPSNNKICHYDKDQVSVILDNVTESAELSVLCDRIVQEATKPMQLVAGITVSFSLNLAVITNDEINATPENLKKGLEQATIAAVQKGANSYCLFSHSLSLVDSEEIKYFKEVKSAINNNEFVLCYQPMVSFDDGQKLGYEALIRWNHKTMGMLSPAKFLKVLEESNNMSWVGAWELETLLSNYNRLLSSSGTDELVLSMNVSLSQLSNPKFFDEVRSILRKYDIKTSCICMEIMDYVLFDKNEAVAENVKRLQEAGFLIAVDNYGLELNSLNMLNKMRIDILKLDRLFVKDMNEGVFNDNIINMLSVFAANNSIKLVATGIEDEETLDKLKSLGVKYGQGYYFGEPKLVNEI